MILLIDNYDSFTYNIAQALGELGRRVKVVRNDFITIDEIKELAPRAIVISPGPGRPESAGVSLEVVKKLGGKIPILGVCLGHQTIAVAHGADLVRGARPVHGKISKVFHDGKGVYNGLRNPFEATRYHSLVVPEPTVKNPLSVSSYTADGEVMGLRCPDLALEGVQFHPESIATGQGQRLFTNFLDTYAPAMAS